MTQPDIHILMAVHNGATHLPEQLASFVAQSHTSWHLHASVDAGGDGSDALLAAFATDHPVTISQGPGQGAAANFMALCRAAPAGTFWAFADQDDIWMPHKLSRALDMIGADDTPTLYCGRSRIFGPQGERLSPLQTKPAGFANALVQNIAGGNTFVMNPAATRLIGRAAGQIHDVVVHDWWVYLMVTGAGGRVIYDPEPHLLYRQHADNVIGANDGWRARGRRIPLTLKGTWRDWIDTNTAALTATRDLLTPANAALLDRFTVARRRAGPLARLRALHACGIYRQSRLAGAAMWVAAALGRL